MAKKATKSVPVSTTVKQPPKAMPARNFFASLRTRWHGHGAYWSTEHSNGAGGSHKIR
jgi:hypothetical protein